MKFLTTVAFLAKYRCQTEDTYDLFDDTSNSCHPRIRVGSSQDIVVCCRYPAIQVRAPIIRSRTAAFNWRPSQFLNKEKLHECHRYTSTRSGKEHPVTTSKCAIPATLVVGLVDGSMYQAIFLRRPLRMSRVFYVREFSAVR